MNRFLATLAVALSLFASQAVAHDTAADWPREQLGTFTSEQGESLEAFMRRVGRVLHDYTRESGNEACGVLGAHGERFAVKLGTDGVPHGCAMRSSDVVEGFAFTGETIHSHPWQKLLTMTPKARAWSRHHGDGHDGSPTLRNDGAGGFSTADRASGAGWLVAKGELMHQAGGKTTRHGPVTADK